MAGRARARQGAHGGGDRPDRRDRPGGRGGARALTRGGADPRHGAPALRPAGQGLEEGHPTGAGTCSTADGVAALVRDADVVVHLAFMIMGGAKESRRVNLVGSRNVFEATVAAGVKRLVYASSVAAYGFHATTPSRSPRRFPRGAPPPTTTPRRRRRSRRCSRHPRRRRAPPAYVFRPCIVAGPQAPLLIDSLPYTQISERLPGPVLSLLDGRADPQARAARSRRALPARPPRRRRQRNARGGARPRQAWRLQPRRRPGQLTIKLLAERARLVLDSGARAGRRRARRDDRTAGLPARAGAVDRRFPRAGDHEHEQGAARAALAPQTRRPAHPARNDHGDAPGPPDPLGDGAGRWRGAVCAGRDAKRARAP